MENLLVKISVVDKAVVVIGRQSRNRIYGFDKTHDSLEAAAAKDAKGRIIRWCSFHRDDVVCKLDRHAAHKASYRQL